LVVYKIYKLRKKTLKALKIKIKQKITVKILLKLNKIDSFLHKNTKYMLDSVPFNIQKINDSLKGSKVKLIAVTKTKPASMLLKAYNAGFKVFGENKVQELVEKYEVMPKDIQWHMIGHLQSNKVKYIAPFIHLIHSVDSLSLLAEINKQALKNNRIINCLLQIYIAKEETKFGLSDTEAIQILDSEQFNSFENIKIIGLMGMASNVTDNEVVRSEFRSLKLLFDSLKSKYNTSKIQLDELSMGMSGDYELAAKEGSTLVRIGSAIFGKRL
jgi:PLP dependent protein